MHSSNLDDEIVVGLIANDAEAWRAFHRRYEPLIVASIGRVIRRFAWLVGPDDRREIIAMLFFTILANDRKKLREFDPARGTRFASWIALLATHAAYDHLRFLRRHRNDVDGSELDLPCDRPDPFDTVSTLEQIAILEGALRDFSERDRTFARLYFGAGMEPEDVAATMKISIKTVYSKRSKIQSRLASALQQPPRRSSLARAS